tara:strand:+ start:106 stop:303 length:198 start_codon:yes stop_codon:yes gene_type:complete
MKPYKLDLTDWKQVEQQCETDIKAHQKAAAMQNKVLKMAKMFIKKLGGKTNEEEQETEKPQNEAG